MGGVGLRCEGDSEEWNKVVKGEVLHQDVRGRPYDTQAGC